jgi:hypothetical protein
MEFSRQNNSKKTGPLSDLFAKFAKKVPFWRRVPAELCIFYGYFPQLAQILGVRVNSGVCPGGKEKTPGSLQSRAKRIT